VGKRAETDFAPFIIQEQKLSGKTRRNRFCALYHSGTKDEWVNAQKTDSAPFII